MRQIFRKDKHARADARYRANLLLAFFGANQICAHLTINDTDRYEVARRSGQIRKSSGELSKAVRARSVEADLQLLRSILRWALLERRPDGSKLLAEYPLVGLQIPKEENPRRPVADYEDFLRVRETLAELVTKATPRSPAEKWLRLDLALVLAEATGRRIGSIRGLRWTDFNLDPSPGRPATIRWDAEFDKKKQESVTPIPDELTEEIRRARLALGDVGSSWVFPKRNGTGPKATAELSQWLREAVARSKINKPAGGLWHPYRRKWATERKAMPTRDAMAVGGWKDERTFRTSYQREDEATMLEVMECPVKLRAGKLVAMAS